MLSFANKEKENRRAKNILKKNCNFILYKILTTTQEIFRVITAIFIAPKDQDIAALVFILNENPMKLLKDSVLKILMPRADILRLALITSLSFLFTFHQDRAPRNV